MNNQIHIYLLIFSADPNYRKNLQVQIVVIGYMLCLCSEDFWVVVRAINRHILILYIWMNIPDCLTLWSAA